MSYHNVCILLYLLYKSHIMFHWPSVMFYVSQKLIGASRIKISVLSFLSNIKFANLRCDFGKLVHSLSTSALCHLQIVQKRERKRKCHANQNCGRSRYFAGLEAWNPKRNTLSQRFHRNMVSALFRNRSMGDDSAFNTKFFFLVFLAPTQERIKK